jgi:hypothetical protein
MSKHRTLTATHEFPCYSKRHTQEYPIIEISIRKNEALPFIIIIIIIISSGRTVTTKAAHDFPNHPRFFSFHLIYICMHRTAFWTPPGARRVHPDRTKDHRQGISRDPLLIKIVAYFSGRERNLFHLDSARIVFLALFTLASCLSFQF